MESQPQNPELRINPENFHPCVNREGNPSVFSYLILIKQSSYKVFLFICF